MYCVEILNSNVDSFIAVETAVGTKIVKIDASFL